MLPKNSEPNLSIKGLEPQTSYNDDLKTHTTWILYLALLQRCWKPGDDERARLSEKRLTSEEEAERERIIYTGNVTPANPEDLDYGHEEWTDEETVMSRLGLLDDSEADEYAFEGVTW